MNKKLKVIICLVLLLLAIIVALMVGSYSITPIRVLQTLLGHGNAKERFAIFQIRLPRMVLALVVASALAVSGGILQGITRNPLAEPGIIGINAGAALFVVIWISYRTKLYYASISNATAIGMPFIAMMGSLVSVLIIYILADYKKGLKPVRFILTGIGVNSGISAIITYYQLIMTRGSYNEVLTWTNGSLWGTSWNYILMTAPFIFIAIIIVLIRAKILDVLAIGDELAIGIGVEVTKERSIFILLATFLAALATSVAGNIAFLGLLGPQIARRMIGTEHRKMLPMAMVISSIILVVSDTIARNAFSPIEIPVGIVVSIIGVPYFVYLMLREG